MTTYIDPDAPSDGVGTEEDPWNTWTSKTVNSGTYAQKAGTTAVLSSAIQVTGANVTITSYGEGAKPIIQRTQGTYSGTYAIYNNQANFTLSGVDVQVTNMHGIQLQAAFQHTTGLTVKDCNITVIQNQGSRGALGIYLVNSTGYSLRNIKILNNTISNTGGEACLQSYPHHVVHYNWTIAGNVFTGDQFGIHMIGTEAGTGVGNTPPYNIAIRNNTFTDLVRQAIHIDCGISSGGEISGNTITNTGSASTPNVNAIQLNWVVNARIEGNTIDGVVTSEPDGVGIILDFGWSNNSYLSSGCKVRRNTVKNTQGPGIQVWKATNSKVVGNIVQGCTEGVNLANSQCTGNEISHNTIVNSTTRGLHYSLSAPASTLYNNVVSGSGSVDFNVDAGATEPTHTHNAYATKSATVTRGGTEPSADPGLNADLTLSDGSICRNAGVFLGADYLDANGIPISSPVDIGAYQYREVRKIGVR